MNKSIGSLEFRSIAQGIEIGDKIVKKSPVDLLFFKTICPGKFLVIISGNEDSVKDAIEYGVELGQKSIVDSFVINAVHESIIKALKTKCTVKNKSSIGVMETSNVCTGLKALDKALKGSNVEILKLQLAFGIGGKLLYIISGEVSDVEYGMELSREAIDSKKIISTSIIPSPDELIISSLTK